MSADNADAPPPPLPPPPPPDYSDADQPVNDEGEAPPEGTSSSPDEDGNGSSELALADTPMTDDGQAAPDLASSETDDQASGAPPDAAASEDGAPDADPLGAPEAGQPPDSVPDDAADTPESAPEQAADPETGDTQSDLDPDPAQDPPGETGDEATAAQSDGDASGGNKMPEVPAEVAAPLKEPGITGPSEVEGTPHPGYIPDARPDDDGGPGRVRTKP